VLDFFHSFLKVCDKKKTHNMIFLMLDPRYRSLHILFSFVGRDSYIILICWKGTTCSC
jgi:hypothetical protein